MDIKKAYIRHFHVLLAQLGIDQVGKEGILSAYGAESSTQLSLPALSEINTRLQEELQAKQGTQRHNETALDKERRRVKVAVGKYLAAKHRIKADQWGLQEWTLIVKTICRAAKARNFYEIPLSRLRGLTYEFNKQRESMQEARKYITNQATY